jgi:hypothetical protein
MSRYAKKRSYDYCPETCPQVLRRYISELERESA